MNLNLLDKIKKEIYEVDVIYGKARAQVLMNAVPHYILNEGIENELTPRIVRAEYDDNTKHLLNILEQEHHNTLIKIAVNYGIEIKNIDEIKEEQKVKEEEEAVAKDETTLEQAIIQMLNKMPPENCEFIQFKDEKSNKELVATKGDIKLMIKRFDGVIAENTFKFAMSETGIFQEEEKENEGNTNKH